MKTKGIYLWCCLFVLIACKDNTSNSKLENTNIPGSYFNLEKDNIKLYLPVYFQKFSQKTYRDLIDALPESEEKRKEKKRFNYLKFSKGNTYYFKDVAASTLIIVKMMKYFDFTKRESSQLLGILSNQCSDYAFMLGYSCNKITAGYSGNALTKVFKAAYELDRTGHQKTYSTTYLVTSNHKTFSISIHSNTLVNYNQFIEKIKVN